MTIITFLRNLFYGKEKPHQTDSGNPSRQQEADPKNHLNYMQKLIHDIRHTTHAIMHDLEKFEQGNKTAGKRVRKASLELEKLYKEFRKQSVHETPQP